MRTATGTAAGPRQIVAGAGAGRSLPGGPPGRRKRICPPSAPGTAGGSAALTSATAASARIATEAADTAARTAARMTPGSTAAAAPPGTMATAATVRLTAATSARAQQRQDVRTPARTKSARGRRNDDGDWPSTEWDKLSDADYWKEVASDKPLVTTARVAQPAPEPRSAPPALSRETASRDSAGRDTAIQPGHQPSGRQEPRRGVDARRGEEPKREATRPPGRGPLEPAVAGAVHEFLTAPTAARYPEPVRRDPVRPDPGRPEQVRPRPAAPAGRPAEQRAAAPMPLDDDPLTSPSFPKIVTSDSRSYHNGRSSASASARPSGPPAGRGRPSRGSGSVRRADGAVRHSRPPRPRPAQSRPPWPVARWRRQRGRLWPRLRRRRLGCYGTAFLRPGRRAAGRELSGERLSVAGARRGDRSRLPSRLAAARPSPGGGSPRPRCRCRPLRCPPFRPRPGIRTAVTSAPTCPATPIARRRYTRKTRTRAVTPAIRRARQMGTQARQMGTLARQMGTQARQMGTLARQMATQARQMATLDRPTGTTCRWMIPGRCRARQVPGIRRCRPGFRRRILPAGRRHSPMPPTHMRTAACPVMTMGTGNAARPDTRRARMPTAATTCRFIQQADMRPGRTHRYIRRPADIPLRIRTGRRICRRNSTAATDMAASHAAELPSGELGCGRVACQRQELSRAA